jgi:hypothetical protein
VATGGVLISMETARITRRMPFGRFVIDARTFLGALVAVMRQIQA